MMKISATGKETTVIEFSKEELEACRLTYENIFRNAIKSKTAIYAIITETAKLSGNEKIIDENTVIDILPDGDGGCIIILNNVACTREGTERAVFFSESIDCFLDLASTVKGKCASSLYETDSGYALHIEGKQDFLRHCGEFADAFSFDEICYRRLCEYGRLLIDGNALEVLGGTASEK